MNPHIVIALSYHGFGHIGQTAPVVQELKKQIPNIKITLCTSAPEFKLREKFGAEIGIINRQMDIGMIQVDALNVDLDKTLRAYIEFHKDWQAKVDNHASLLSELKADLMLSNVSYLALAGANQANIPAIGFCSLNWADIFAYYFHDHAETGYILDQMKAGYNSAKYFLTPEPSMSMPSLNNVVPVGPIAQPGINRREEILIQLGKPNDTRIILISVGGMELDISIENWPRFPNSVLLVPDTWDTHHPDMVKIQQFAFPFIDLMYSSDLLITKPGYGSFVEAACSNTPVLYLQRKNWPEINALISWLEANGQCSPLNDKQFAQGNFFHSATELLSGKKANDVEPTGISALVDYIIKLLPPQ